MYLITFGKVFKGYSLITLEKKTILQNVDLRINAFIKNGFTSKLTSTVQNSNS